MKSRYCYWRSLIATIVFASGSLSVMATPLVEAFCTDGRCRAVLSVSPEHPFLADTITLTLDVICPDGNVVEFPPFGETLGDLNIVDTRRTDRQLILMAMPQRAGTTPIWEMTIRCGEREIVIPATSLTIATSIDSENASLDDIGLTTDTIPEPRWHLYALIAAAVLAALFFLWLLYRRKKSETAEEATPLSAQEIARQRLAALLESQKHESDIKGFFVELSDIVRWYVERLTGIRAPELTTEEFLHKIARPTQQWRLEQQWGQQWGTVERRHPSPGSLESLVPFLEAADIVKFAKHVPTDDEVMLAFRRAEQFIRERS